MLLSGALGRTYIDLAMRNTGPSSLRRVRHLITRVETHQLPFNHPLRFQSISTKPAGPDAAPNPTSQKYKLQPRFLIYHAGSGRISFLACLKITTLFIFTFFGFVVTPAYYQKEGLSPTVMRAAVSAIVPVVFVAYITSPFVLFMHLRLPPIARHSEETMRRYLQTVVKTMPPEAELEITTMSLIAKPRVSVVRLAELRPVNKRFGVVNLTRDTAAENATRKWYMFRAVGNFSTQITSGTPNYPWFWNGLWESLIAKHA
ncbi:hypothetical protein GGR50DRAFT_675670 [Xylaria sp. CBS 124048]|nr:hypothetical protein GGR50DRAFT_675670 [Xylaria sp. CBS 124048]